MYTRLQTFNRSNHNSFFLWGARQTGKSTLLKKNYPDARYIDLLKTDEYIRYLKSPSLLRESLLLDEGKRPVIIDEVQKVPMLLDEVHWLIENKGIQFILSGSSPRKILRSGVNLLGGRAYKYALYPLIYQEIDNFDLIRALNQGLIPRHYDAKDDADLKLQAYLDSYLEDEIIAETKVRDVQTFSRFLEKAAFSNGEIVNYSNIATDCAVSGPTVKEYFNILVESLVGYWLPSFQKKPKRRILQSPKFYFFDVGIANQLLKRKQIDYGSSNFGQAFEHFIFLELHAHSHYSGLNYPISFWRTSNGNEVDFIVGDHELAIEIKSTNSVNRSHTKGLKMFSEEYITAKKIIISNDPMPRLIEDNIIVYPWSVFLEKLWSGEIITQNQH